MAEPPKSDTIMMSETKSNVMKPKAKRGKQPKKVWRPVKKDDSKPVKRNSVKRYAVKSYQARGPNLASNKDSRVLGATIDSNSLSNINIEVPISGETLSGVAIAAISYAYAHGYREYCDRSASTMDNPYLSYTYMYRLLGSVVSGNLNLVPKVKVPVWLRDLAGALAPKSEVRFSTGTVSYKWLYSNPPSLTPSFKYPLFSNSHWYFAAPSSQTVSAGYNKMTLLAGSTDETVQAVAFTDLMTFMNRRTLIQEGQYNPWEPVDMDLWRSPLSHSTSAFAAGNKVVGKGLPGGYFNSIAASECYVDAPRFSVFATDVNLDRGFRNYRPTAGDSHYLVSSMMNQVLTDEYRNSNYTIFKPVDFDEFATRLAEIITKAASLYAQNTNFSKPFDLGLSDLEFLIALRYLLMRAFSATQFAVQTMYPAAGTADDFIPFLASSNTCASVNGPSVTLPILFVESINALRARSLYPTKRTKSEDLSERSPRNYVPVLGRYAKSTFNAEQYYYGEGESKTYIFSSAGFPYDLISGTVEGDAVDLVNSDKMFADVAKLNDAMQTLSPFLQQPTLYNGDAGLSPLATIGDTYIVEEIKFPVNKSAKTLAATPYDKIILGRTTQQAPIKGISSIKRLLITPEMQIVQGQQATGNIAPSTVRTLFVEPWWESMGEKYKDSGVNYINMSLFRSQFVDACVKNFNAEDSEVVKQITYLSTKGKAGILGDLVQSFGPPLATAALTGLGKLIPF